MQYLIVQWAGADLVTYMHMYFRNKNFKGNAQKKGWILKSNRLTYVMAFI